MRRCGDALFLAHHRADVVESRLDLGDVIRQLLGALTRTGQLRRVGSQLQLCWRCTCTCWGSRAFLLLLLRRRCGQRLEGCHRRGESVDLCGEECLRGEHPRDLRVALTNPRTQRGEHTRGPQIHLGRTDTAATQNGSRSQVIGGGVSARGSTSRRIAHGAREMRSRMERGVRLEHAMCSGSVIGPTQPQFVRGQSTGPRCVCPPPLPLGDSARSSTSLRRG